MDIKNTIKEVIRPIWINLYNFYNVPCESTLWYIICNFYNSFINLVRRRQPDAVSDLKELIEIEERSRKKTDISDHLVDLFIQSLEIRPKLIVELGVGGGESTFVLERVARICNSVIVSVDIDDCSQASSYMDWHFIQKDDIVFARDFDGWCIEKEINPQIDALFIDTRHLYEHTMEEIGSWFPFLSDKAKVFFHDTNLTKIYFRKDHSMGLAWNNERGVIKALEKYFNRQFNEKVDFIAIINGWLIKHNSHCCGFTILEKLPFHQMN
jgi:hypothetical protein